MLALLRKSLDIRSGEGKRLLIMAGYNFVVIASYNVLKPMTRSLFVSNMGLAQLPYLYILLALTVAGFVVVYLRISAKARLDRLLNMTMLVLMASLLLFRWLLQLKVDSPALFYGLFIWASIYGVLTTSQFWLLANYVFNAREAKRLFSVLTSAGLAGAIMGGYFTTLLVKLMAGTANLAFFCLALLVAAQGLMNMAWGRRDKSIENIRFAKASKESDASFKIIGETFGLIKNSRHLGLLICIVMLTYMVVQIADFQFVAFASEEIADTDELTSFLGLWLSNLSIIALLFQLVFANAILKRFGVGATMLFLPITLLVTTSWVLMSYGLTSILAIKLGDGAFRHSIHKVGMELLYLPIPQQVKKKTKTFIDMFADRFARGIAGLLLLVFYTWVGLSVAQVGIVSIVLTATWLVLAFSTYRAYVNSFRQAISRRQIDLDATTVTIKDKDTIRSLRNSLESKNERQIVYALQVLRSVDGEDLEQSLCVLLKHGSAEVRENALDLILAQKLEKMRPSVLLLLKDPDEKVRREALKVLVEFSRDAEQYLSETLRSDDLELRGAALQYLAGRPELANTLLTPAIVEGLLKQGERARALVAETLGVLKNEIYYSYLNDLLNDDHGSVRMRAMESAGKTGARQFIPVLVHELKSRRFRLAARQALAAYGDAICDQLGSYLCDPSVDFEIRLAVPRVLSLIGSQRSVDLLIENLSVTNGPLRYQTIKGLNKLRANWPDLNFDKRIDDAIFDELRAYFGVLATAQLSATNGSAGNGANLLSRALRERLDDHLESVFRLLGLRYPPKDIANAFAATISSKSVFRANAIEFLDNILSKKHKKLILPIVDDLPREQLVSHGNSIFKIRLTDGHQALARLIEGDDAWLTACALYHIGKLSLADSYRAELNEARESAIPVVRETADLVLKQFA